MARTSGEYRATNTEIASNGDVDRDLTPKFPLELEDGSFSDEDHDEFMDENGEAGKKGHTFYHVRNTSLYPCFVNILMTFTLGRSVAQDHRPPW